MKLLKIETKEEGGQMPDAFIAFGRCRESERVKTMYGTGTNDERQVYNGFYARLQMPFTKKMKYVNSDSFEVQEGPCRLTLGVRARRPFTLEKTVFTWLKFWTPVK